MDRKQISCTTFSGTQIVMIISLRIILISPREGYLFGQVCGGKSYYKKVYKIEKSRS